MIRTAALCAALAAALAAPAAQADRPLDTPAAIEVDRDATPAGRVGLGFDAGEPIDAWGASLAIGLVEQPIALSAGAFGAGSPATRPVRRRQTVTVGGALAVGDRVVLDGAWRASHQIGDRLRAAGNPDRLARYVVHDLRLGGRLRVAGDRDSAVFLRADVTLPTGDDAQFAGDARWTAAWRLIGRLSLARGVVIAGGVGIRLHGAEVAIADRLIGDELCLAAGVAVPLGRAVATGELAGALGDNVGMQAAPSPLEARLGAHLPVLADLVVGARVGAGLVDQIGAPSFRAIVELAWTPRVARPVQLPSASEPAAQPALDGEPDPDDD